MVLAHPQALLALNPFQIFDLPRQFDLSRQSLRARYIALQRQYHPDSANESEKSIYAQLSAHINHSYQILSDPILRAQTLLELAGYSAENQRRDLPTEFLQNQLIFRERLDEAHDPQSLSDLLSETMAHESSCERRLMALFATSVINAEIASEIGMVIRQWMFWQKLSTLLREKM